MKRIYSGLEDGGKTLQLAMASVKCLYRNHEWQKITKNERPIVSNLPYTPKFYELASELSVPVRAWKDLDELPALTDCDLFIDEVGTYFDARTYANLPLDVRLWLAQASKLGVDIYGAAQDFAQVDISFRRLTSQLFFVRKLAGSSRPTKTRPGSSRIWGVCAIKEMDPVGYDENTKAFNSKGFPWFFTIRKAYCEVFDTTKRVPLSDPPPYKHVLRRCTDPGCNFGIYQSKGGVRHKVIHV